MEGFEKIDLGSSETCALDAVSAVHVRDVCPGEIVIASGNGLQSRTFKEGSQKLDIFEFIYFARPDSYLLEKSVLKARENLGIALAKETTPVNADVVIDVPDSSTAYAIGYSQESGIPFKQRLIKNRYTGRTFQRPHQERRRSEVLQKLNPVKEVIANKRVIVVDDSLVRGTTLVEIVKMIRQAGAREVHVRIGSPPVMYPDFYGIDTPTQAELIGAHKSEKEICEHVGADSLEFLSLEAMIKAIGVPKRLLSTSCFTGEYPIDIGKRREEIIFQRS